MKNQRTKIQNLNYSEIDNIHQDWIPGLSIDDT